MMTRRMVLPKLTIGLDLGDRFTQLCAVDIHGQVVATDRLRTTPAGLERQFAGHPCSRIVLEVAMLRGEAGFRRLLGKMNLG